MESFTVFSEAPSNGVWKAMIIKAVILAVLGIFCLVFPFATMNLSAYLLGFFLLIVSIAVIFSGFAAFGFFKRNWLLVVLGVIGICLAIYSFINPVFMVSFATIFVGIIAIVAGIVDVVLAFGSGLSVGVRILTVLLGVVEAVVGIIFLANPALGAEVLVLVLGIALVVNAVLSLVEAFVVRKDVKALYD